MFIVSGRILIYRNWAIHLTIKVSVDLQFINKINIYMLYKNWFIKLTSEISFSI